MAKKYVIIGSDKLVWPAGATTLDFTFRPGQPKDNLPDGYRLVLDTSATALAGASVSAIDNLDTDAVSGAGNSAPATLFFAESRLNTLRFRAPAAEVPPVVRMQIATAPVADVPVSAALVPPEFSGSPFTSRAVNKAKQRVKTKARAKAGRRKGKKKPWYKRAAQSIWSRLPFVSGLGAVDQDALAGALAEELAGLEEELLQETLGAVDEALDEVAAEGMGAMEDEED